MANGDVWIGGIVVVLANGTRWDGEWEFKEWRSKSKPAAVLRAAREEMRDEKVRGRSFWVRYTIEVILPKRDG